MRSAIESSKALAFVALTLVGCMPTDVGFSPPSDIDEDCPTLTTTKIVRSASDARSLPQKCFMVSGDVEVVGSDLFDLTPLIYLRQVNVLRIKDNPELRTLDGLDRVKVMDHIEIDNNPMLEDILGLDRTEAVTRVTITKNPQLRNLAGLRSLQKVGAGGFWLGDNANLEGVQDLERLERIEGPFRIERNGALASLETYRSIDSVGDLLILANTGLRSLGINVAHVDGDIRIEDNSDLLAFDGFSDLQTVGKNFSIKRNRALQKTNGFTATFNAVGSNLTIDSNVALTDIYDLAVNLITVGGSVIATNNTSLSICRAEDLNEYIEEIGNLIDIGDNGAEFDPCH